MDWRLALVVFLACLNRITAARRRQETAHNTHSRGQGLNMLSRIATNPRHRLTFPANFGASSLSAWAPPGAAGCALSRPPRNPTGQPGKHRPQL